MIVAVAGVTAMTVAFGGFGGGVPLRTGPAGALATVGCYLSPIRGELAVDPAGEMTFDAPEGTWPIAWPYGYTAQRTGTQVAVRNWQGEIVARSGESVELWVGPPRDRGEYVVCG